MAKRPYALPKGKVAVAARRAFAANLAAIRELLHDPAVSPKDKRKLGAMLSHPLVAGRGNQSNAKH
jgi:hypothetical protein